MRSSFLIAIVAMLAGGTLALPATAQTATFGATSVTTDVEARALYIDNFFYDRDDTLSATGLLLRPRLFTDTETSRSRLSTRSGAEFATFNISGNTGNEDNYIDYNTGANWTWVPAVRHSFSITGEFFHGHDPFGTNRTEAPELRSRKLDQWNHLVGGGRYRFGAPGATANLEVYSSEARRYYTTNRDSTRILDHRIFQVGSLLTYELSPKTAWLANIERNVVRFGIRGPGDIERSGVDLRLRSGIRWFATARTTGDLRIGYFNRSFSEGQRDSVDGLDWVASLAWNPRPRTEFLFQTGRRERPSFERTVSFIDNRFVSAAWDQEWGPRFKSEATVRFSESRFVGTTREDDVLRLSLHANYILLRTLSLIGGIDYTDRDSELEARDFDRLAVFLGVKLSP